MYTEIYDSLYQQAKRIIEDLENRRKKIILPNSSFIIYYNPKEPTTKSIFLSNEEWFKKEGERKDIDDDV